MSMIETPKEHPFPWYVRVSQINRSRPARHETKTFQIAQVRNPQNMSARSGW